MASLKSSLKAPEDNEQVAIFVTKLWGILGKHEYNHLIAWSEVSAVVS